MMEDVCNADLMAVETSWHDFERARLEFSQQANQTWSPSPGLVTQSTPFDLSASSDFLRELLNLDEGGQLWEEIEEIKMDVDNI